MVTTQSKKKCYKIQEDLFDLILNSPVIHRLCEKSKIVKDKN